MDKLKNILSNKSVQLLATLAVGLLAGWLLFGSNPDTHEEHMYESTAAGTQMWTCSMHPQINMPEPGQCPLCGMDLIPKTSAQGDDSPIQLKMTSNSVKLAQIQTVPVSEIASTQNVEKQIFLNGSIKTDERRIYSQTTHFTGRIESLNVNFTGEVVKKGQVLATIYAPDLVNAQYELLESINSFGDQPAIIEAAKEKLRKRKLSDTQIEAIINSKKVVTTFPLKADFSGTVHELDISLGDYVKAGEPLMTLIDLSKVWAYFEVYENNLVFLQKGSKVTFEANGLPAKTFEAKVDFIEPSVDPAGRVALARADISGNNGALKPGMFIRGQIMAGNGKTPTNKATLTIPNTAIMWTGKRSVVYVKVPDSSVPTFEAREVELGAALGNTYEIISGLAAGEEVVAQGTFTVDAASQLNNKASMMNRQIFVKGEEMHHNHDINLEVPDLSSKINVEIETAESKFIAAYLGLKDALVSADFDNATKYNTELWAVLKKPMEIEDKDANSFWQDKKHMIMMQAEQIAKAANIDEQRRHFITLSADAIALRKAFGGTEEIFVQYCPMANNDAGAYWLSSAKEIRNPYYGDMMLTCGEVKESLKGK